ncbi:hypothetical protein AA0488_2619 [Kozakia baliensis NRIC 0488]|uniref:Uncharacterized protein n=1 Tax=Kozakia baliensis TaxID=153496 RepID=A0A1D8UY41_9PROT|nr:hypothetical protein A0U89_14680 [Kozakia baliensis]GBR32783.1 hypothetical protein AA0488_2619 [Kozakia baliensis NRIC 0488]GEL65605.1 hypothetical protein KBA01_28910 [Kozakia baliensis]
MNFGDLAIEVVTAQAQPQQFDAVHLRFDAASSMISVPSSPDGPSELCAGPQGFIPDNDPW